MNKDYGILIQPPVKLQRNNFKEMCSLLGVNVLYSYPLKNKGYTTQGELETGYSDPKTVSCIFQEFIDQKTAKKLGWDAELQQKASLISVPYDLEELQVGCLFTVPSAFDNTPGRTFRVIAMSAIQMYPASISCELVPEYASTAQKAETEVFVNTDFNLLNSGE